MSERTCRRCGIDLPASVHGNRRYCSENCQKRAWDERHYTKPCPDCGTKIRKGLGRCIDCDIPRRRLLRAARRQHLATLWESGFSSKEIAQALGTTTNALGVEMARMRAEGFNLTIRRKGWRGFTRSPAARRLEGELTRVQVRRRTTAAIREGLLIRPTHCENCHQARAISAHHTDYSQPLQVEWLCHSCHSKLHWNERQAA